MPTAHVRVVGRFRVSYHRSVALAIPNAAPNATNILGLFSKPERPAFCTLVLPFERNRSFLPLQLSPCSLVRMIQSENLLSGLWGKPLLVCAHAGQRTESHAPIQMRAAPEFVAAIVTLR